MKRVTLFLAVATMCVVSPAYALWSIGPGGTWPKTWPQELEPLRKQSWTLVGGVVNLTMYEIPFTKREEFEAAWPHILKVKSKGAPIYLIRSPDPYLGRLKAGVYIHCPPGHPGKLVLPEETIGTTNLRERWLYTYSIGLVVDGQIVDLNRIALPADTPIIDERFNGK